MEGEAILKEFLDENLAKDTISFNFIKGGQGCDNMSANLIVFKK